MHIRVPGNFLYMSVSTLSFSGSENIILYISKGETALAYPGVSSLSILLALHGFLPVS